jgi:hypothetical protein
MTILYGPAKKPANILQAKAWNNHCHTLFSHVKPVVDPLPTEV